MNIEFTESEWEMILKYMEYSGSKDAKIAIMNAISIAFDDADK